MKLPDTLNFLLVEDLVSDSFLLQRQLKKISAHPEIRFVDSEISLINALKTYIPDILITDFNLIGMDAFDVIRIAKDYNSKIPIVVITAHLKNESDKEKLFAAGAVGFFIKEDINTLNEKLRPLFYDILEKNQEQLASLSNERKKYATEKKHNDFLRQHTFTETNTKKAEEVIAEGFWTRLRSLFSS